ncbi:hypothetical protein J1605_020888 [Eschrichtius robustus]|uniref:Uncharacterized protein n=1 Tax=Eschrichtius robustus TaxID=9764 RepID=A0AB34HE16_ESCRO|nr:hypothetical protein J1605_020888 [Eschrichtius robustus]
MVDARRVPVGAALERRRLQLESRARSPARSLRPRALAREPLAGSASVAPPAPSSSSSSRAACSCPGAGSRQGPGAEGRNPTVSESSRQAGGGGAARGRSRRVALRRVEVRGAPGGGCNRRAGGGGPRFPARPSLASGAGIRVRPLPASWLLAGSSRALPGDHATEPIEIVANSLLFLRVSPIVCLSRIWRGSGDKEAPRSSFPGLHTSYPASSRPGARLGKERSPTPAGPPHLGLAVRGRRESCSFPASSGACGPGRISQVLSPARRRAQVEMGASFGREWKRGSAPIRGVLWWVPVDSDLRLKACGLPAARRRDGIRACLEKRTRRTQRRRCQGRVHDTQAL